MGNLWLKIKVWTKVIVFSALFIYGLLFIYNNSGKPTEFWWWFGHTYSTSVFFLTSGCFFAGVIVTLMIRTTFTTLRQIRQLQDRNKATKLERDLSEMKLKASKLNTRQPPRTVDLKDESEEETHQSESDTP